MSGARDVLPGDARAAREATTVGRPNAGWRLRVDPLACDGIGICAHLAPELVRVDSWGYPILPTEPLRLRDLRAAQTVVTGCPRRALFLQPPG